MPAARPVIMGHEIAGEVVGRRGRTRRAPRRSRARGPGALLRHLLRLRRRPHASLPARRRHRPRDQRRVCRIRRRSAHARLSAARLDRKPDRAAHPGADDVPARSAAGGCVAGPIGGRGRAWRLGPAARAAGEGARGASRDRREPQRMEARARADSLAPTSRSRPASAAERDRRRDRRPRRRRGHRIDRRRVVVRRRARHGAAGRHRAALRHLHRDRGHAPLLPALFQGADGDLRARGQG